jgi:hypothetical protein
MAMPSTSLPTQPSRRPNTLSGYVPMKRLAAAAPSTGGHLHPSGDRGW